MFEELICGEGKIKNAVPRDRICVVIFILMNYRRPYHSFTLSFQSEPSHNDGTVISFNFNLMNCIYTVSNYLQHFAAMTVFLSVWI